MLLCAWWVLVTNVGNSFSSCLASWPNSGSTYCSFHIVGRQWLDLTELWTEKNSLVIQLQWYTVIGQNDLYINLNYLNCQQTTPTHATTATTFTRIAIRLLVFTTRIESSNVKTSTIVRVFIYIFQKLQMCINQVRTVLSSDDHGSMLSQPWLDLQTCVCPFNTLFCGVMYFLFLFL